MGRLLAILVACILVSGGRAAAFDDAAFFGTLPTDSKAVIERCAQAGQCTGLDDLNQGQQLFKLTVWEREVAGNFPVEVDGERLITAARTLERVLAQYYRWPAELPRRGRIDLHRLPGVVVSRKDFTIALSIEKAFAPATTIGGRTTVRPEDFTTPGTGLFGLFNARARTDGGEAQFGFDADVTGQWQLWQFHTRSSIDPDGTFGLSHAYAERPLLESARRLRAGLMYADTTCAICLTGRVLGISLTPDSLGGLLYSSGNSASFEVEISGNIDEIEIFRNGTRTKRERAIPGYHTIVVDNLQNGTNLIEIYGLDRQSGQRQLLASGERTGAANVLEASGVEYGLQAGWAQFQDAARFSFAELDFDNPFVQLSRRQGLGDGREIGTNVFISLDALLAEQSLQFVTAEGQIELGAIASLAKDGVGGGGRADIRRKFGEWSVGAGTTLCADCYDSSAGRFEGGLQGNVRAYLSTRAFGWSASAALTYDVLEPEDSSWRINLSRSLFGGRFNAYALDFLQHRRDDNRGMEFGLRFSKSFGGERLRQIEAGIDQRNGTPQSYLAYRDHPRGADGVFAAARLNGTGMPPDTDLDLEGEIGYQDSALRGSIHATGIGSDTAFDVNITSGFAWVDGQFAVTRNARGGGFLASSLTPNSPIFINGNEVARSNPLGQAHVPAASRSSPARVTMHEDLGEEGQSITREREALLIPRYLYGLGEKYRKQERSYRLLVGSSRRTVSPGVSIYDANGEEIGVSGYDGIVTLMGVGEFEFEDNGESCTGAVAGEDSGDQEPPTLTAICHPVSSETL